MSVIRVMVGRVTPALAARQVAAISRGMKALRTILAALAVAPGALAAQEGAVLSEWRGNEVPLARVVWSEETADGILELRDYAPFLRAEVRVRGGRSGAASEGFRRVAGYIFGGNAGGTRIAMTSPVAQAPEGDGTWTVAFAMPRAFALEDLPAPDDPAVRLVRDPGGRRLSLGFASRWDADGLERRSDALLAAARARGLTPEGTPEYLFYDGPMTPSFRRRNEVSVPVR